MKNYEISTEVKGAEKFLVIKDIEESALNRYHLKMVELNSIHGIMPLRGQSINGCITLNYPLGERFQLLGLISQNSIGSKEMKIIYKRIVDAIMGVQEYFLDACNIVYNLEHLYVDSRLNPYMLYIPVMEKSQEDINHVWKEFFLNLLSYASSGKEEPFYDKLMRLLIQPNFSLGELYNFLKEDVTVDVVPAFKNQEISEPKINIEPVAAPQEEKQAEVPKRPGIAIPGAAVTDNAKEKKAKPLFQFGKKKDKKDAEKSIPLPVAAVPEVPVGKKGNPAPQNVNQDGNGWSNTVFIEAPVVEKETNTIMLNQSQPHLMHGEVYVPLSHFPFTIGKISTSYIVNNPTVSRKHATIFKQGSRLFIQDEGSSNHTYVNGIMLTKNVPVELSEGAVLRLSNEEFIYHE